MIKRYNFRFILLFSFLSLLGLVALFPSTKNIFSFIGRKSASATFSDLEALPFRYDSWEYRLNAVPRGPRTPLFNTVNALPHEVRIYEVFVLKSSDVAHSFNEEDEGGIPISEFNFGFDFEDKDLEAYGQDWIRNIEAINSELDSFIGNRFSLPKDVLSDIALVVPLISSDIWESVKLWASLFRSDIWPKEVIVSLCASEAASENEQLQILWLANWLHHEFLISTRVPKGVTFKFCFYTFPKERKSSSVWATRMAGANHTTTPLISFFDGDDILHPLRMSALNLLFQRNSELDLVLTSLSVADYNSKDYDEKQSPEEIWNALFSELRNETDKPHILHNVQEVLQIVEKASDELKTGLKYESILRESSEFTLNETGGRLGLVEKGKGAWYLGSVLNEPAFAYQHKEVKEKFISKADELFMIEKGGLQENQTLEIDRYPILEDSLWEKVHENDPEFLKHRHLLEKYHISHQTIKTSWYSFECANGWPTVRRELMEQIPIPYAIGVGEDALFNFRVLQSGFNLA